jgi:chromosome segregation ATPase
MKRHFNGELLISNNVKDEPWYTDWTTIFNAGDRRFMNDDLGEWYKFSKKAYKVLHEDVELDRHIKNKLLRWCVAFVEQHRSNVLKGRIDDRDNKIELLEKNILKLNRRNKESEKLAAHLEEEKNKYEELSRPSTEKLNELNREIENLKRHVDNLDSKNKELSSTLLSKDATICNIKEYAKEKERELENVRNKLKKAEVYIDAIKSKSNDTQ